MQIKDKVIIVTGASEGIGLAAAKLLASRGAKVVLAARSADKIAEAAKECGGLAIPTDMRKPEDIENLIEKTVGQFGRIDILINNAGQGIYGPIERIDVAAFADVMDLNVFAVVRAMQGVIPVMRKQGGGMILNISSRVSKLYIPGLGAYAATKYALNAISLTARQELAPDNIIVSVMLPKMTATRFGVNAVGGRRDDSRATGQPVRSGQAASAGMEVDTPEEVAEKIAEQIESEEPEASM